MKNLEISRFDVQNLEISIFGVQNIEISGFDMQISIFCMQFQDLTVKIKQGDQYKNYKVIACIQGFENTKYAVWKLNVVCRFTEGVKLNKSTTITLL